MELIAREFDLGNVHKLLASFPCTAILGPRQCGKTTLARQIAADHYFDLENPTDQARLDQPKLALEELAGLIVIDEIQRAPQLFELLRFLVDSRPNQRYLILGSASRELIRQSGESLAGRIAYYHLGGLLPDDVGTSRLRQLWQRGGFPRSFLADGEESSNLWRRNFITTFLERDIPQLGISIPAATLRRFWTMLAHYHGQVLNYSELARSFDISVPTVKKYIDILQGTFTVRLLQPWHANLRKRLVKSPKLYLRDSGLLHTLLSIENHDQLLGHPRLGTSWEGFALEVATRLLEQRVGQLYFWATHAGAEVDLLFQAAGRNWGVEFKYQDAPRLTRSMRVALADLQLAHLWVVYPGREGYRLDERVTVLPLPEVASVAENPKAPPT